MKKILLYLSLLFCFCSCSSLDLINHDAKVGYFFQKDSVLEREEVIYLSENYFKFFYSYKSCSDQFSMRRFIKENNIMYAEYFEMKDPKEIVYFAKECQGFTEIFLKDKFKNSKFKIHSNGYLVIIKDSNNKIVTTINFLPKQNKYNNRFATGIMIEVF